MNRLPQEREQEWQFSAQALDATREWIARQPAGHSVRRFAPRSTLELHDTYFDSADWMIFRAGFALRLRHEREEAGGERTELTLKALSEARRGLAQRIEISENVPTSDLEGALSGNSLLAKRIRALVGARALSPLFHAHTLRERQQLLEADTELPLAEVDLDRTSLRTPGGATRELTRVEVECLNAEPAVLEPLVEQLRTAAQLEPANESKFRTGLNVAGLDPTATWKAPQRTFDGKTPIGDTVLVILGRYFETTWRCEPQVRFGSVEAVHEMRVSARHLHVLLKAFAQHAPRWAVRSRRTIRLLVSALGAVRDCDVQLAWLDANADAVQSIAAGRSLRTRLETERQAARAALLDLLDAADTRDWGDTWRLELTAPVSKPGIATALVARDLIRTHARKLRKRATRIDAHSSPDEYHEVRIRAKRLRYTLDAFETLYGAAATEYLRALGKLQDLLGDFHDATLRAERFTKLASEELPGAASFAMGRLVERDTRALDICRNAFPKAYRRIRRRRWRALREAMESRT